MEEPLLNNPATSFETCKLSSGCSNSSYKSDPSKTDAFGFLILIHCGLLDVLGNRGQTP